MAIAIKYNKYGHDINSYQKIVRINADIINSKSEVFCPVWIDKTHRDTKPNDTIETVCYNLLYPDDLTLTNLYLAMGNNINGEK